MHLLLKCSMPVHTCTYTCILNCVFYTSSKLVYDVHVKKMSHMSSTLLMKDRNKKNSERSAKQKDNQEKKYINIKICIN